MYYFLSIHPEFCTLTKRFMGVQSYLEVAGKEGHGKGDVERVG